jgi:hypothetical protein
MSNMIGAFVRSLTRKLKLGGRRRKTVVAGRRRKHTLVAGRRRKH